MGSKFLGAGVVNTANNAPLYGYAIANLVEETEAAITAAVAGDSSAGIPFGLLTDLPSVSLERETVNILDNVPTISNRLKGSEQLQSEQGTISFGFVPGNLDVLRYAFPGAVKAAWSPSTAASITAGTGNSAVKLRAIQSNTVVAGTAGNSLLFVISTPTGTGDPQATVTVTGTAPAYTITVAPKTTATANDVIAAINAHATAKTLVQAGKPTGSTGAGVIAAFTSASFTGGAAGSRIGYSLNSQGYWSLSDYIRNVAVVWETVASKVGWLAMMRNAISTDNFEFAADDSGAASGISVTLTATADESDYNASTGNYNSPFTLSKLDDVTVS